MGREPIKVLVRLRPSAGRLAGIRTGRGSIAVELPKKEVPGPDNSVVHHKFQFDGVLEDTSQEDVFKETMQRHMSDVIQGYSAAVIAYGATSSGKTYTMSGNKDSYSHRGLIPRALSHLFLMAQASTDRFITTTVSCLEIYNDQMYDLLSDKLSEASNLQCLEDASGAISIKGLTKKPAATEQEALAVLFTAQAARARAATHRNSVSSRSHFIFTVHLEVRRSAEASEKALASKLVFADLAGSERAKKAGASGQVMKEAAFINRSLSFLQQTANALAKGVHAPFRQHSLTANLKCALDGSCRTTVIAHISSDMSQLDESVSTLRFTERIRQITTNAKVAEVAEPEMLLRRYERQLKELKQELAMRDVLAGRGKVPYGDMDDSQLKELRSTMRQVLKGEAGVEVVPMQSIKSIQEALKMCTELYQELSTQTAHRSLNSGVPETTSAGHAAGGIMSGGLAGPEVGRLEKDRGFGFGEAPLDARPPTEIRPSTQATGAPNTAQPTEAPKQTGSSAKALPTGQAQEQASSGTIPAAAAGAAAAPSPLGSVHPVAGALSRAAPQAKGEKRTLPKSAAFGLFKQSVPQGQAARHLLKDAQAVHKERTLEQAICTHRMNELSQQVAKLKAIVKDRESSFPEGCEDPHDEELLELRSQLLAAKDEYKECSTRYHTISSQVGTLVSNIEDARRRLVTAFEAWYDAEGAFLSEDLQPFDPDETYAVLSKERIMAEDPTMMPFVVAKRETQGAKARLKGFQGTKAQGISERKKELTKAINFGTLHV